MTFKSFAYYGIGALALIALADKASKIAIMFVVILIASVVLTHWQEYSGYLSPPALPKPTSGSKTAKPTTPAKNGSVVPPWLQTGPDNSVAPPWLQVGRDSHGSVKMPWLQ